MAIGRTNMVPEQLGMFAIHLIEGIPPDDFVGDEGCDGRNWRHEAK